MDKAQKELIKTYYRKRMFSINQEYYSPYEMKYGIDNQLIDVDKSVAEIKTKDIAFILKDQPDLIEYFKSRLYELGEHSVGIILGSQPGLVGYFKKQIEDMSDYTLINVLRQQPQIHKHFFDINEFDEDDLKYIYDSIPQLKKHLGNNG